MFRKCKKRFRFRRGLVFTVFEQDVATALQHNARRCSCESLERCMPFPFDLMLLAEENLLEESRWGKSATQIRDLRRKISPATWV